MFKKYLLPLLAIFIAWFSYYKGYQRADEHWRLEWEQRNTKDSNQQLAMQAQEIIKEQQLNKKMDKVIDDAKYQIQKAKVDTDNAKLAGIRLRKQLKELRHQLTESYNSDLSKPSPKCQASHEAVILLTELLHESDQAAGQYAKEADNAYLSGLTCEKAYSQINKKLPY